MMENKLTLQEHLVDFNNIKNLEVTYFCIIIFSIVVLMLFLGYIFERAKEDQKEENILENGKNIFFHKISAIIVVLFTVTSIFNQKDSLTKVTSDLIEVSIEKIKFDSEISVEEVCAKNIVNTQNKVDLETLKECVKSTKNSFDKDIKKINNQILVLTTNKNYAKLLFQNSKKVNQSGEIIVLPFKREKFLELMSAQYGTHGLLDRSCYSQREVNYIKLNEIISSNNPVFCKGLDKKNTPKYSFIYSIGKVEGKKYNVKIEEEGYYGVYKFIEGKNK